MEKRLFVITNATHYINVKNYIANKPKGINNIILTIRPFKGYKKFIDQINKDPELKIFGTIFTNQESPFLNYFTVFKNILKIKKLSGKQRFFDKILFTNYKSWSQHFIINQFETNQKILISDGAGIVLIADFRKRGVPVPLKSIPFNGNKFFKEKVLGIKPIENLHFYSQINIDVAKSDSLEIFKFKSSNSQVVNSNRLYFVGSPLVEIGYLPLNRHLDYLKLIKKRYSDFEITYFAHRRERDENMKEYTFFGEVIRNETPFEEKMEKEVELPGIIMSYISSILINLYPVYPQIKFYYFPLQQEDIPVGSVFLENYAILKRSFEEIKEVNFQKFLVEEINN